MRKWKKITVSSYVPVGQGFIDEGWSMQTIWATMSDTRNPNAIIGEALSTTEVTKYRLISIERTTDQPHELSNVVGVPSFYH